MFLHVFAGGKGGGGGGWQMRMDPKEGPQLDRNFDRRQTRAWERRAFPKHREALTTTARTRSNVGKRPFA